MSDTGAGLSAPQLLPPESSTHGPLGPDVEKAMLGPLHFWPARGARAAGCAPRGSEAAHQARVPFVSSPEIPPLQFPCLLRGVVPLPM